MIHKPSFFFILILLILALSVCACRNNSPTNSAGTAVPMAFSFQNNLAGDNVIQLDFSASGGVYYTFGVPVASGATTVFNFKMPAGTYSVNIIDTNHKYDYWGPTALSSGDNLNLVVNPGAATLNSVLCNPCGF